MAEIFLKGSAYSIPFLVKSGKTTITNENVASVRLGLGNLTASWPGGRLRYSGGYWLFPVTQAQSYALPQGETYYQAQIQMASGETFSSKRQCIFVDGTIFRTPFGETQLTTPETADAQPIPAQIEPKPEQIAVEIQTLGGGLPSSYVLPPATSDKLGGVKADAKTEDDTVPARIDTDGKLWVKGQRPADWRISSSDVDGYIQNRPGGYYSTPSDASVITWDGTKKTGADRIEVADLGDSKICFYHVSDAKPTLAALVGGTLVINGETVLISDENNCTAIEYEGYIDIAYFDVIYINIIYRADVNGFPKSGTWFVVFEDPNGNPIVGVTKLQTVAVGDIVKIPGKFLDLPIPTATAADAGKIVTVGADGNYALAKSQFLVTLTPSGNGKTATADKTVSEILTAYNNGQIPIARYAAYFLSFVLLNGNNVGFSAAGSLTGKEQTNIIVMSINETSYTVLTLTDESFTDSEIETFYNANA